MRKFFAALMVLVGIAALIAGGIIGERSIYGQPYSIFLRFHYPTYCVPMIFGGILVAFLGMMILQGEIFNRD